MSSSNMPASGTSPLTDTVGSIVTASLQSHGRAAYRRGEAYAPHSAESWRAGWIAEAELCAAATQRQSIADAMSNLDALAAVEQAALVLRNCTVSRPTISQARVMATAKPVIEAALDRLRPAPHGESEQDPG